MSEEQKDDALVFLECNTEELAGLPKGQGMQAVANVRALLNCLPTIKPNAGGNTLGLLTNLRTSIVQFTSQI